MTEYISLLGDVFIVVFAIISIFEGARRLVTLGSHRSAVIILMPGIILCAAYSSINFVKYKMVTRMLDAATNSAKFKIPLESEWSNNLTPERRQEITEMSARSEFYDTGKLISYLDKEGRQKIFSPTQDNIRHREEMVLGIAEVKNLVYERFIDIFRGILAGMFAALLGVAIGRHDRAKSSESTLNADSNMHRSS